MKKITLALVLLCSITTFSQSNSINYKALIKDAGGAVLSNSAVTVQFTILEGTPGTSVYQETHTPTTDGNGVIVINIGEGTVDSGIYADIDWGSDDYFLNTQIDTGTGLTDMGTTGFNAVPYALSAKTVQNISGTTNFVPKFIDGIAVGDSQLFDDGSKVGIGTTNPQVILDIQGVNGPRARIASTDGYFAGLITQNATRQYFVGTQGTWEAADVTNSGFQIYDNTAGALRMVIDANGNMGINNFSPTAKLDVTGNVKIVDGTEGAGKVLTSDADGLASWEDGSYTKAYIDALEDRIAALELPQATASIGDLRAGGVVFWVDPADNTHGLVCALSDYVGTVIWGCPGTNLTSVPDVTSGPTGPGAEIGYGMSNTNAILTDCPSAPAALAARSFGSDWFLPSINELNKIYVIKATLEAVTGVDSFSSGFYYSSTEGSLTNAWVQFFGGGSQSSFFKTGTHSVRAVRAF